MTYLEQVEPHLVDNDVLAEMFNNEALLPVDKQLQEWGAMFPNPYEDLDDYHWESICEQIVRTMKYHKKKDYLVAFGVFWTKEIKLGGWKAIA